MTRKIVAIASVVGLMVFWTTMRSRAQEWTEPQSPPDVLFIHNGPGDAGDMFDVELPPPDELAFDFVEGPIGVGGDPVKSAPYSAEAVTEVVRTLADGNRIVHESTATVYRDGNGRTRREQSLAMIGPLLGGGEASHRVIITDPQAGVTYLLNPDKHTARKLQPRRFQFKPNDAAGAESGQASAGADTQARAGIRRWRPDNLPKPDVEQLGKQVIEGVEAEGTRSTMTIPAGTIGNEQPIKTVMERWYSPDLRVIVQSKRSDPRFGEHTYRLTNIVRAEPSPSLFDVPSDYKVVEGMGPGMMRRRVPPPPPQD